MLKRFLVTDSIDGVNTEYNLPSDYIGASVNVFVNGVLYATENITDHIYGFYIDFNRNVLVFYEPLKINESLFILYDSDGNTTGAGGFTGKGTIEIEANKWQLCAIPVAKGEWKNGGFSGTSIVSTFHNYITAQLEDKYNLPITDMIEVANTKVGDLDYFFTYIPGFTDENSEHNFSLVYVDKDNDSGDGKTKFEVTGFWIKSKCNFALAIDWEILG